MTEAQASHSSRDENSLDRRALLGRLAATSAIAWAAPEILATKRASAMAHSGCYTDYDFDDGTLQGWTVNNAGQSGWQISGLHSFSGSSSAWFGRAGTSNSLHPTLGEPSYRHGNRRVRGTLTSPSTTVSSTDLVLFQVRLAIENSASYDTFRLYIIQGGTRVQLWDKSQGGFAVIDHPENPGSQWDLYTTQGAWNSISVTVGTPTGINLTNPVQFEFDFQSVDGVYNRTEGIYLDNIMLPCSGGTLGSPVASTQSRGSTLSAPLVSGFQGGYRPPPEAQAPAKGREPPG